MTWAQPSRLPDSLKLIPLGGLNEVGLNMLALECRDRVIIIDAGLMFPNEEMLGVDLVVPDCAHLSAQAEKIGAIILTHGHEDHIGALPFVLERLNNPPIYGSAFTLALVAEKLREHGIQADLRPVDASTRLDLPPFAVEFIPVAHSIPQGFGLKIETPLGTVVHTGDFKVDHTLTPTEATDLNRLAACGQQGVLALLSDSTNVEREGYTLSETAVRHTIQEIFQRTTGRIMIASFASNIRRVQQVVDSAAQFGRKVVFAGKSLVTNVRLARELGLISVPAGLEIGLGDLADLPPRQLCVITTGSQGEPLAALTRIALGEHKQIRVEKGDVVVLSSRFIPGHELAISRLINHLYRRGADVLYERVSKIHTSGHGQQEELKLVLSLTRPRYFIPVHGERRHLVRHARLAEEMGVPANRVLQMENGDVAVFDRAGGRISGQVETGRLYVDGKGMGDTADVVLRDRRHLSAEGVVFVLLVVDSRTGEILSGPEVVSRGFVFADEQPDIMATAKDLVSQVVGRQAEPDWTVAQDEIRRVLRRYFSRTLDRQPVILPMIMPM